MHGMQPGSPGLLNMNLCVCMRMGLHTRNADTGVRSYVYVSSGNSRYFLRCFLHDISMLSLCVRRESSFLHRCANLNVLENLLIHLCPDPVFRYAQVPQAMEVMNSLEQQQQVRADSKIYVY
jgi:hypothetical protein